MRSYTVFLSNVWYRTRSMTAAATMPKLMNNAVMFTTMSLPTRQNRRTSAWQRLDSAAAGEHTLVLGGNVLVVEQEVKRVDVRRAPHQPYPHLNGTVMRREHTQRALAASYHQHELDPHVHEAQQILGTTCYKGQRVPCVAACVPEQSTARD